MAQVWLKMTLPLILLFVFVIGIIRAQPYDDHGLRDFLTPPDGCPAPCFMGIRPGVTTTSEVMRILADDERIENIRMIEAFEQIRWDWDGQATVFFDAGAEGTIQLSANRAEWMHFQSKITFADFLLSLGTPPRNGLVCAGSPAALSLFGLEAEYPTNNIHIAVAVTPALCPNSFRKCPLEHHDFWEQRVNITFGNAPPELSVVHDIDYNDLMQNLGCNYVSDLAN